MTFRLSSINLPPSRIIVRGRASSQRPKCDIKDDGALCLSGLPPQFLRHPKHAFAFVIDALDEGGDDRNRTALLKALTAACASWLKMTQGRYPTSL